MSIDAPSSQTLHAGRLIARRLKASGIDTIFTLSGGHLFSIYDGCRDEGIRLIDTRHEQTATFAAEGWSKVTRQPGVAALTHSDEVLNASNTINGGMIALVAEEAALSLSPGATLASLDLRYLQPARVGPVVARAEVRHGLGRVEVRDEGNDDRLCVVATTRTFPP